MKKNYFFSKLILCGLFTLATATTFVGCKDYDDDIDNLQSQITANGEAIKKLQDLVGAGKFVTAVEATDKGIKVTLNDNTSTEIELAKKGEDAVAPQLQVKDGVWQISLDNGKTFTDMKDATTGEVIKMPEAGEAGTKVEITPEGQIKIGDKVTDFMKTADFVVIDNENRSLVFKIGDQTVYVPMAATTVQSIVFVPRYTDKIARAYSLVAYVDANGDITSSTNPKDKKELVAPRLPFDYEINPATVDLTKAVWAFNTTKAKVATRAAGTSVIDVDASTKPVIDGNKVTIWGVVNDKYEEPEGTIVGKTVEYEDPTTYQMIPIYIEEFVPEEAYMASALMTYKLNDEANAQEIASDYTEFRISEQNASDIQLFRSDRNVAANRFGLVDGINNYDPSLSETVGNLNNNIFRFKYDDAAGLDLTTLYGGFNNYNVSADKLEDLGLGKISVSVEFATEKTLKNYLEKKLNTTSITVDPALKALLANSKYYNLNAAKTGISVKSEYGIAAVGNNNGALLLVTYKVGDLVIGTKVIKAVASKEAGVEGQSYTYPNPIKFVISQTSNVDAKGNFVAGQETSLVEVYKTAGYTPEEFASKLKGIAVKTVDENGDEVYSDYMNGNNFVTPFASLTAPTFNLDASHTTTTSAFTSKTPLTIAVGAQTPVGTYTLTADITLENSVVFTITATVVVDYPFTFDAATLEAFHAESWWKANNTDMQIRGIYGKADDLKNPGTFALEGDMENAYKEQFTLNGKTFVVANFGQLEFEEIPVTKYEDNAYFNFAAIPVIGAQKAGNPLAYNLGKAASVKVSFKFVNGETLAVETPNVYMVNPVKNPKLASAAELQQGNPDKSKVILSDLTELLDQNGNKVYAPKTASAAAGLVNDLAKAAVYGVTGPTYELMDADDASVDAFEVLQFADPATNNSVIIKQGLTLQKERTVKVKVTFQTIWGPVSSLVDVTVKPQAN